MKIFLPAIIILISTITAFADITYPQNIVSETKIDKGRLIFDNAQNIENTRFYLINANWINNNETISYWKGLTRNDSKGEGINGINILEAIYFDNALRLVVKEQNSIHISSFDTNYIVNQNLLETNISVLSPQQVRSAFAVRYFKSNKKLFLLVNNSLNEVKFNEGKVHNTLISDNVLDCVPFTLRDDYVLAYLVDKNDIGLLYFVDYEGKSHYICRIPITNQIKLFALRNYLLTMNSVSEQSNALVGIVDINSKHLLTTDWAAANINYTCASSKDNYFITMQYEKNNFNLTRIAANNFDDKINVSLPSNLGLPLKITDVEDNTCALFSNAIILFDKNLNTILLDYHNFNELTENKEEINIIEFKYDNVLVITTRNTATLLKLQYNKFWFINKNIKLSYKFAVPAILILISLLFYRKYRNQYRLLNAVLELPSSGFIFFINKAGKLVRLNQCGMRLLNLSDNIPHKKQFTYYCRTYATKQFVELIQRGLARKMAFEQKINIMENNISREWLCWLIPLHNSTGRFSGIVFTGIDITDALEKQILNNWSQLAHDMQTNLSTIRLNTETINANSDDDIQRKQRILYQISILVNRIRDIVTVGRDDKLELSTVNAIDFCLEITTEFDSNIFSAIEFKQHSDNFNFLCDKPKLLRAVRNAVENSIKYMKKNGGTIIIGAEKDIHNITISVKDTGQGMDKKVQDKIFTPYFSTARREGGHGIGTIIMQRVMELHGGKIIVKSEQGVGTEILFILPDISRKTIKN